MCREGNFEKSYDFGIKGIDKRNTTSDILLGLYIRGTELDTRRNEAC